MKLQLFSRGSCAKAENGKKVTAGLTRYAKVSAHWQRLAVNLTANGICRFALARAND